MKLLNEAKATAEAEGAKLARVVDILTEGKPKPSRFGAWLHRKLTERRIKLQTYLGLNQLWKQTRIHGDLIVGQRRDISAIELQMQSQAAEISRQLDTIAQASGLTRIYLPGKNPSDIGTWEYRRVPRAKRRHPR